MKFIIIGCTNTYDANTAVTIPGLLASHTTDLTPLKNCMTDPTAQGLSFLK